MTFWNKILGKKDERPSDTNEKKSLPSMRKDGAEIYITIGSPWVPADVIDAFITHILRLRRGYVYTKHDLYTGTWELPQKKYYKDLVASTATFGTSKISALDILEKTLNMQTVVVKVKIRDHNIASGYRNVIDKNETTLALEKQKKLIEEFKNWVFSDMQRKERLVAIYIEKFNVETITSLNSTPVFNESNSNITLYPYQIKAIEKVINNKNTLLAHDVGSGKTYIMISAAMELKIANPSIKNLFVVPNNIVGQWRDMFLKLYPYAKLLIVDPKSFVCAKRKSVLQQIKDENFDGIIMAYSCFEQITLSSDFYVGKIKTELQKIKAEYYLPRSATASLERKRTALEKKQLDYILNPPEKSDLPEFEALGITNLFIDEAHNFKNVPIDTKVDRVLGINAVGSKKCELMLNKVRHIQNSGGRVIMATGTPITNSITDAFIFQNYLQPERLEATGLQSFDSWIGMFAEKVSEFEVDVDTSSYRLANRFARFHNLPELTQMLAEISDFHSMDKADGIPEHNGYEDIIIKKNEEFEDYLKIISKRAESVRNGYVLPKEDNMLKITTDGRKAALDMRLIDSNCMLYDESKVVKCTNEVLKIYRETEVQKSTQLIFCDTSTPKREFNIYDALATSLIDYGVKPEHIAFVHNYETETDRSRLFEMVRRGEIRILLGSTFKLGLGVNVQNKLIALHHIDVPWRPADITQREGRILRQGNENKRVKIFRYITEGSFDAYSWQLLETKQRFITELLAGSLKDRSSSNIDSSVLNYAEVKALAVGNPLIKKRVETANELTRLKILKAKQKENRTLLENELLNLPQKISDLQERIIFALEDLAIIKENPLPSDEEVESAMECLLNLINGEEIIFNYRGFEILRADIESPENKCIYLSLNGKYLLEIGNTVKGSIMRINNFINGFDTYISKLKDNLLNLKTRQTEISSELNNVIDYDVLISDTNKNLEKIDKELGLEPN